MLNVVEDFWCFVMLPDPSWWSFIKLSAPSWDFNILLEDIWPFINQGLFCHDQESSGNFLEFFNLWHNLQMFLYTMEPRTENKNSSLEKKTFDNVGSCVWNDCLNCQ